MEEKCVCSVQIWKEVFDHFDRQPKKIETNENYSIDEDAKETLQEKIKPVEFTSPDWCIQAEIEENQKEPIDEEAKTDDDTK